MTERKVVSGFGTREEFFDGVNALTTLQYHDGQGLMFDLYIVWPSGWEQSVCFGSRWQAHFQFDHDPSEQEVRDCIAITEGKVKERLRT